MNISGLELQILKSSIYAVVQMPEKQKEALKGLTKNFNKMMTPEQKQEGRDKSRFVINSIIDDGFAEQDRLEALDNENK